MIIRRKLFARYQLSKEQLADLEKEYGKLGSSDFGSKFYGLKRASDIVAARDSGEIGGNFIKARDAAIDKIKNKAKAYNDLSDLLRDRKNYLTPEEIKDLKSKTHKSLHRFIDDYEKTGHNDTRNKLKELSEQTRGQLGKRAGRELGSSKVDSDSWRAPKEVQQAALKDRYIDQREEEYREHLRELDRKDTERLIAERQRKNAQIPQTRPKEVVTQEQSPSPDSEKVTTQPQPVPQTRPKQQPRKGRGNKGRGRDNRQPQPSNPIPEQSTPQKQEIKRHKRGNVRRGQNPDKAQPQNQAQLQPQPVPTQEAEPQTTTSTSQGFFGGLRNKWSGLSTGQKIGVGALGLVGTGLAGYGIKKWRDKRRKKRELEERERINRAVLEYLRQTRR